MFQLPRRNFLMRSLALPFLGRLSAQETPFVDAGFHLHPHYRAQTPLDATLLKTKAGFDDFITEKYHDQIAAILAEWRAKLLASPKALQEIAETLNPRLLNTLPPAQSRIVRPGPALEVRRIASGSRLGSLSELSTIHTAEFQITRIDAQAD